MAQQISSTLDSSTKYIYSFKSIDGHYSKLFSTVNMKGFPNLSKTQISIICHGKYAHLNTIETIEKHKK